MKTLGTLCALFCVFFLLETMAMEDSADSAASAGGVAEVHTDVCATVFVQWIQSPSDCAAGHELDPRRTTA